MHTESSQSNSSPGTARLEFLESGVAVLYLGSHEERVVTLTQERMVSIEEAIQRVRQQKPPGLVITGPNRDMFTAGADINAIRSVTDPKIGENLARQGQLLFDEIESLTYPTIAAISGPCVGGGCELVLACKYRIISDEKSSGIGLPETKLGILPGFGGTQRLPRLIGLPKALDIILAGKVLKPKQASLSGLVDAITKYEGIIDYAAQFVLKPFNRKPISFIDRITTNFSIARKLVRKKVLKDLLKQTKGFYPAPIAALDSVLYGLEKGQTEGLLNEAKELGRLIITPESKGLVNVFFLSEASKSLGKGAKKAVQNINALVVGAGAMGAGIAGVLAKNDATVILKDTTEDALKRGVEQIKRYLASIKYLSESDKSFILNRIEICTKDSPNTGSVNLIIEAVFEDLNLKTKILSELAKLAPSECIIASNTSSLSIASLANNLENPDRVIGMHFFNPVEKMPLVEVIRGKQTSDKNVAVVCALAVKLGKYPIVVEDVPGFLVNRILTPYLNEAAFLLEEGYSVRDIDRAATSFGMPMGPIRLLDEVGLDVASHVSEIMIKGYGDRMKGPAFARALLDKGRKGKKSGEGFYDFKDRDSTPSPILRELLGIKTPERKDPDIEYITKRLIYALINEGVKCLDEGVAGSPGKEAASQVDLGTVMGMGFPPFRGGLLFYANSLGVAKINTELTKLASEVSLRFAPAPGITRRVDTKKSFFE